MGVSGLALLYAGPTKVEEVGVGVSASMASLPVEETAAEEEVGFSMILLPFPSRLSVLSGFLSHQISVKGVSPSAYCGLCFGVPCWLSMPGLWPLKRALSGVSGSNEGSVPRVWGPAGVGLYPLSGSLG